MNTPRPVLEPDRYGYQPEHGEEQQCLGCRETVTFDEDMGCWWIPYETGNPPAHTFTCRNRAHVRHMGSPPRMEPEEVNRDVRLRLIAELVSYVDLHIGKYAIRQLTTQQKELWADLVDSAGVLLAREDPSYAEPAGVPPRVPRWWRSDFAGPTGPDHPLWDDDSYVEPDPFARRSRHVAADPPAGRIAPSTSRG